MDSKWIKTCSGYAGRYGFIVRRLTGGNKFVYYDYVHLEDEPLYSSSMAQLKKLSDDSGSPE